MAGLDIGCREKTHRSIFLPPKQYTDFSGGSDCKASAYNAGVVRDTGSIPGLGRFPWRRTEIDVFLELSCFFHDPADVGNLISGSSAFSETSLNIRKFTVHILLKPGLENFEHTFMHWRRKWQPTPVFLPGESQGRGSLVGCHLWGCTESDMTEAT